MSGDEERTPGKLAGRRVLVVEDEYFLADDVARALIQAGAHVIGPVPRLGDALALLAKHRDIDGAVLDINLRGEAVYPLAEKLREQSIPFCFATGYDVGSLPPEYRDVPRWTKPFDAVGFVARMSDMILPSKSRLH